MPLGVVIGALAVVLAALSAGAAAAPFAYVPNEKSASVTVIDTATGHPAQAHHQRSDVCAVPAAGVVAEAMTALVLAEVVLEKFGGDSVAETTRNLASYVAAIPETLQSASDSDDALG